MSKQQKQLKEVSSNERPKVATVVTKIEKIELKSGILPEDRHLNAQFKHYCSESYAKTISYSSCASPSLYREESVESIMVKNPLCRTRSKSAPASPKGGVHKTTIPSSAFPSEKDSHLTATTKKKKSASISNFFRKISPRLRKNVSKDSKPWIVVEFTQGDIDGKESARNNLSFEMALKNSDASLQSKTNGRHTYLCNPPPNASDRTSNPDISQRSSLLKVSSRLQQGVVKLNKKSSDQDKKKKDNHSAKLSKSEGQAARTREDQRTLQGPDVIITLDSPRSQRVNQPPQSLYLKDKMQNFNKKCQPEKMVSLESIGNCSLDVDSSINDSMILQHSDTVNTSDNTLRSISLDDLEDARNKPSNQHKESSLRDAGGGYLFRTLFSKTDHRDLKMLKLHFHVPQTMIKQFQLLSFGYNFSGNLDDSNLFSEILENSKKPSYLNISCSISGYGNYSQYQKSRDNSPARQILSRSRDSSPMPGSKMISTVTFPRDNFKENQTHLRMSSCDETDFINKKVSLDAKEFIINENRQNGERDKKYFIAQHEFSVVKELKNINSSLKVIEVSSNKQCVMSSESNITSSVETLNNTDNVTEGEKGLVRQRIEKLFAQSEKDGAKVDANNINGHSSISYKGSPPVFRHLRKEFRDQLNVRSHSHPRSFAKFSPQHDHLSSTPAHNYTSALNGHAHNSTKNEKPTPPKKPEGLLPMSSKLLLEMSSKSEPKVNHEQKRDGHYFIYIMDQEAQKINDLLVQPLRELEDKDIPEEASGKIRSAVGKATLLTTKKFSQFRELCEKNVVIFPFSSNKKEDVPSVRTRHSDEQFSTFSSDLEGFWDMVMLQVTDIYDTFSQIDKMRKNGWKEDVLSKNTNGAPKGKRGSPLIRGQSKSAPTTPEKSAKAAAAAKAREEARKRLMAAKKKGRKSNIQNDQDIEIFAP
ncbi:Disks large-associated protein 1 [Nymphon striatum]|nr:Disks large-associated protein 1 [Nymphon striatum]